MSRQKPKKEKTSATAPARKPLSVRYAEVLKLRQAILQIQSAGKVPDVAGPASK